MTPPGKQNHGSKQIEAMGLLAPAVAHDINNLLSGILGYSELLSESAEGQLKLHVEEIVKAARRIASLTRILMAFKPRSFGHPEVLDLGEMIREMERFFPQLLGDRIECSVEMESGLWPVRGEWTRIMQALILLSAEMRDGMPEGGNLRLGFQNLAVGPENSAMGAPQSGKWILITADAYGIIEESAGFSFQPETVLSKDARKETAPEDSSLVGIIRACRGHLALISRTEREMSLRIRLPAVV
jgi:two-component system cell cycle sensor histidine kinase/response regulator CckA